MSVKFSLNVVLVWEEVMLKNKAIVVGQTSSTSRAFRVETSVTG